ncbi:MAG: TetR family transcriptional regulator [Oleiphilus sp.]
MCLIKQRANNPEQKALRRQQILQATEKRFRTSAYEEVNLNHIAKDVGITKAALYRYFRNKETLFLALFVESLEALIESSNQQGKRHSVSDTICNVLIKNPVFCKLSAILHTILERNLTLEEASEFKLKLLDLMAQFSSHIQALPGAASLNQTEAIQLLMQVQQALIGVWHMTHPTGAIAEVIETPPLTIFKRRFEDALKGHIEHLVNQAL